MCLSCSEEIEAQNNDEWGGEPFDPQFLQVDRIISTRMVPEEAEDPAAGAMAAAPPQVQCMSHASAGLGWCLCILSYKQYCADRCRCVLLSTGSLSHSVLSQPPTKVSVVLSMMLESADQTIHAALHAWDVPCHR